MTVPLPLPLLLAPLLLAPLLLAPLLLGAPAQASCASADAASLVARPPDVVLAHVLRGAEPATSRCGALEALAPAQPRHRPLPLPVLAGGGGPWCWLP